MAKKGKPLTAEQIEEQKSELNAIAVDLQDFCENYEICPKCEEAFKNQEIRKHIKGCNG